MEAANCICNTADMGNLFQLTYNMVDSIVVGQFAGQDALAAVGTSDPVHEFTDSWCRLGLWYWCNP